MASSGSGYDLSPTTFSPDGRIFQVEYAGKAVDISGTAIGLHCCDGIVMGVEKLLNNKMLVPGSNRRIHTIDKHAGLAITGATADGRQIVNRARSECVSYEDTYGSKIPSSILADRVASYIHYFTLHGSLRPFGSTVIAASYDPDVKECALHMLEPSGMHYRYFGCAAGKGRQGAKTEIEKFDLQAMTCEEGVRQVARIIHMLHDDAKDKPFELELSWLTEATGWEQKAVPKEVREEAEKWAVEQNKEDDDDEMEDE